VRRFGHHKGFPGRECLRTNRQTRHLRELPSVSKANEAKLCCQCSGVVGRTPQIQIKSPTVSIGLAGQWALHMRSEITESIGPVVPHERFDEKDDNRVGGHPVS
jgi:hypothetical protein